MILSNFIIIIRRETSRNREHLQDCGNGTLSLSLVPKLIEGFEVEKLETYFTVM